MTPNNPVLLTFYCDDCGSCQTMDPVLDLLKIEMENRIEIIRVDVNRNASLIPVYQVKSVPTFILLKNKQVCWRQSGLVTKRTFEEIINQFNL
ncbi:MAG: thioredoxin family protein [Bacteroidia bacterium]|nr:thioredoxin family protein [Bacteroidia bacterium]